MLLEDEDTLGLLFDRSGLADDRILRRHLAPPPTLTVPPLRPDVWAIARRGWEDRTRSEYIGVMIARRLHGLFVDLNAPSDLQELALTMTLHEQQHTGLCAAAARALGSDGEVAFTLSELQQTGDDTPIALQAAEMICGTLAVGEVTALALIRASLRALPKTGFREILRRIAKDEVLHATLGPALIRAMRRGETAAWLPWPGDQWARECRDRWITSMQGRAVLEDDERALSDDEEARHQLATVGLPPADLFLRAYHTALRVEVPRAYAKAGIAG